MPPPEPLDLLDERDPVLAFDRAREAGRPISLPTSGSTGRPRTIVRTTASWTESFDRVSALTGTDVTSRVWVPGPVTGTMNLFARVHAAAVGARVVDSLSGATHAHLTPTVLRRLLTGDRQALAGRHLVVAGDRLDAATHDAARSAGAVVSHYYGAAELSFVAWGGHAGSLRPFPEVEVEARGGLLWVRSPFVCTGYLDGERLRRDADGWVSVGDRGDLTGGVLTVHGREGGITTGGTTVTVAEVEHALRSRARGDVVVLGLPHPDLGEVVTAVVTDEEDLADLREAVRDVLAHTQRPRRWYRMPRLPVGPHGKLDRAAIRATLLETGTRP